MSAVAYDPLRDKRYRQTRLGRDVVDFLAWKELEGAASRTLDQYERDFSPGCLMFPLLPLEDWSDAEIAALCDLPVRDGALMQILFDAGLRKGEARRLRLMHVIEDVRIIEGKGGKSRIVPATVVLTQKVNELAILDGLTPRDHFWYSRPGGGSVIAREKPIGEGSFDRWWRRSSTRRRSATAIRTSRGTRSRRGG